MAKRLGNGFGSKPHDSLHSQKPLHGNMNGATHETGVTLETGHATKPRVGKK